MAFCCSFVASSAVGDDMALYCLLGLILWGVDEEDVVSLLNGMLVAKLLVVVVFTAVRLLVVETDE